MNKRFAAVKFLGSVVVVLSGSDIAAAQSNDEVQQKQDAYDLQYLSQALKHPAPEPGREHAHKGAAPWCAGFKPETTFHPGPALNTYAGFFERGYVGSLISFGGELCGANQKDPVIQDAVGEVLQQWINFTGLTEKDAIQSIAARIRNDSFKAAKQRLCGALTVSDEVRGEDRAFMNARATLFGCNVHDPSFVDGLWSDSSVSVDDDLLTSLDQSASEPDELVRLASVVDHVRQASVRPNDDGLLVSYAIDSIDYRALSDDRALKALAIEPYANNVFATVIVKESLARAHMGIAVVDDEVTKHASDADWKETLIGAPRRGVDAYRAEAAKYKDAIARSNDFERKLFGPSKKAVAGCEPTLRKDLIDVWKTLKHNSASEAQESLSDPVASLLYFRYLACMAIDGDPMVAQHLYMVLDRLRYGRGERAAAYYATIEALAKIKNDRERFPIGPESLKRYAPENRLRDVAYKMTLDRPKRDIYGDEKGLVKSVSKSKGGLVVTFATQKHQEVQQTCGDTNRILAVRDNGTVEYYRTCSNGSLEWVNDTPTAATFPTEFADGGSGEARRYGRG